MADIILFGAPGCGKGTQAKRITSHFHVSTGDLFRKAVAEQTSIGKRIDGLLGTGNLIPDEITLELVEKVCTGRRPIAWDGFPRTLVQARALDVMNNEVGRGISHIFNLEVPDEVLLDRVLGRFKTSGRPDDNPEAFKVRLATYREQTAPLLRYYSGRVVTIDGTQPVDTVSEYIKGML